MAFMVYNAGESKKEDDFTFAFVFCNRDNVFDCAKW